IGDAAGTFSQDIKLPPTPDDRFPALATRDGVTSSSPNFIRVSSFPNVLEAEPNDDFKQFTSTDIAGPVAFNGILQQKGDVDVFRFNAKKGQIFEVNAYGQKVRSPIDTVLNIYDSSGRNLQGNDDSGSSDSYLRFTAPADAAYFVRISDHLGRGGPEYVYRVELTEVQPLLTVSIPQVARNDSQTRQAIAVPRGNRFTTLISVKRDNFRGDLVFQPIDLPAGVTLQADKLPAGQSAFPLVFEAAADAPIAGRIGDLTAKYVEGDQLKSVPGGHKQMIDWVMSNPNQTVYYQSAVTGLTVAVVEEVPFSIDIVVAKVPLTRAGTMDLKVVATRKDGFDEPITVSMVWNPPGVGSVPSIVIPKGQTTGDYRVNANGNADLRSWKIAMMGSAEIKSVRTYVSTKLADIEIADQFVSGKFEFTKTDQGQTAKVICKLDQKIPFEGKAKVTLQGLPPKVVAPEREITKDMTEVVFDLTTEATSPAGTHRSLFCTIVVPKNNESITHTVASGGILRIDSPRPAKPAESKPAAAKLSAKAEAPANK
ncbi:MAG TPA: PPC domain-containing protein, partial [Roseimicrobium sp.]|nr:PPC domain-containing protein [Roseimicrobium sp.]